MDITQLLQQKYAFTETVPKEEYDYAQATMPADQFSRTYIMLNNQFFRYVLPKESELSLVILNDNNRKLADISKKMKLIWAAAIIGICGIGLALLILLLSSFNSVYYY